MTAIDMNMGSFVLCFNVCIKSHLDEGKLRQSRAERRYLVWKQRLRCTHIISESGPVYHP